jgi:hypothetical protein
MEIRIPEFSKEPLVLTEDERAVSLKALKDIRFASATLEEWIKSGKAEQGQADTILSLLESYHGELAKPLKYESHLTKEREERYADIRRANKEIHQLKEQIGSSKPIDGLAEQLRYLHDIVSKWWREHGFNYVSDEQFGSYSYRARFCFQLDSLGIYDEDRPVTGKKQRKDRIKQFEEQGFEFIYDKHGKHPKLAGTNKNLELVSALITSRFPSAAIHDVKLWMNRDTDQPFFRDMEVYIRNYADIVGGNDGEDNNPV